MTTTHRGRALYHNSISYYGGLVVLVGGLLLVFTLILQFSIASPSPYLGIFTYLIFPGILTVGVVIFLFGMRRESIRRRREAAEAPAYPRLDLNDPTQRRRFAYGLSIGTVSLIVLGAVAYNGFVFTESVTFCGKICHTVMQPEYTAYLSSPHARVRCVDCHVGTGASWYVKSKLSGVRQVFATLSNSYPRPIPVPVKNLRPARATCEECHWPDKFWGAQLIQNPHFHYDENNTAEEVSLLVKTGGGNPKLGQKAGIHWHMIIDNTVTFAPSDESQQHIPWVKVRHEDGSEEVYTDQATTLDEKQIAALPRHVMDCINCHNRPTHIYPSPGPALDVALASGFVDPSLPWIKKVAADALVKPYTDRESAAAGIREDITSYYEKSYPSIAKDKADAVREAAATTVNIYDRAVFPKMDVNWKTYPNNIGHRNWPGCFRCHDGRHATKEGKVLTHSCTVCHTMPQRGPLVALGTVMPTGHENWHPWQLEGKHAEILCNRCHAAGYRPPTTCATCHDINPDAPMIDLGCDTCHAKAQQVKPLNPCSDCHSDLPGLHQKGYHPEADCTDCHHPHTWLVTGRETCLACHDDKADHHPDGGACTNCHDFTS